MVQGMNFAGAIPFIYKECTDFYFPEHHRNKQQEAVSLFRNLTFQCLLCSKEVLSPGFLPRPCSLLLFTLSAASSLASCLLHTYIHIQLQPARLLSCVFVTNSRKTLWFTLVLSVCAVWLSVLGGGYLWFQL